MSVCEELDPMVEHMTQFTFKARREHIAKANIPDISLPKSTHLHQNTERFKKSCNCTRYC